jgi:hypothetical protein
MKLIDSHTHLYLPDFDEDRDAVIARANALGIDTFLLPAIDASYTSRMEDLKKAYPNQMHLMTGLHPTHVKENYEEELDHVEELLKSQTRQERELSKNEYHNLLGEAKMVFSANLQETLGISWYEGALVDTIPMVPDRLSYSEMAVPEFLYPSKWTEDFASYRKHRGEVVSKVHHFIENYQDYLPSLDKQRTKLNKEFFSGKALYEALANGR